MKAFLEQNNNFVKSTFVLDRHPRNEHLFRKDKGWSEVTCETPEGTVTPFADICHGDISRTRPCH